MTDRDHLRFKVTLTDAERAQAAAEQARLRETVAQFHAAFDAAVARSAG